MPQAAGFEDRLIVALDVDNLEAAGRLVDALSPVIKIFKIGSQFFTAAGPGAVEMVHRKGGEVFLDLKFHDIPNTVARASEAAVGMGVFMFNLHAQGGTEMMRRAVEAVHIKAKKSGLRRPLILGVTVLTSVDEIILRESGIARSVEEQVSFLVGQARAAGLDGGVASGREIGPVRRTAGDDFIVVVPGVRPGLVENDDQKRVITPREAIEQGADYLVIGRPITAAADPRSAAEKILREVESKE